jgi:hypothetical protein
VEQGVDYCGTAWHSHRRANVVSLARRWCFSTWRIDAGPCHVGTRCGGPLDPDLVRGAWSENRAGQRVQLAILSDPVFNWTLWLPSEFIALDSAGKSYSTSVWSNLGSYSTEADREVLYRWTAKFSDPLPTDVVISVWRRPYSGGEFDTGIQLQGYAGNTLCANYTDELTLYVGDEIMFSIDVGLSVRHVEIFSHRVDNS